jgi:hypothetical protein
MAKGWNFSGECLTSKKECVALNKYLCSHLSLCDKIEKRMGMVHGIEDYHVQDDDCNDNTDVLSSAIIHDQLGIIISKGDAQVSDCVVQTHKDREHGGLVAADNKEDVWAWNDGEKWGDELPVVKDDS